MIKTVKFIKKYEFIEYIVDSEYKSENKYELRIPFIPEEVKNYSCYISIDDKKFIELPTDVVTGERGFTSKERDEYFEIIPTIDNYFDNEGKINIREMIEFDEISNMSLNIYDLTEEEINGYEKLDISSKPIWLFNGIRKYMWQFDKELFKNAISITFKMKNKNNEEKEEINYESSIEKSTGIFFLDTDKIGKLVGEIDPDGISTNTYIEIKLNKLIINYPIDIKIIDVSINDNIHKTEEVAIDFGTSSTCIAYSENQMLHFSDRVESGSEEEYENMTSFFIYNWDEMKKIWNDNSSKQQLLKLKTQKNEKLLKNLKEHFGDGRNVQDLMSELEKEKLSASVFEIKNLATLNKNTKFRQYYNFLSAPDLELGFSEEAVLNPIEFYAYLIGRKLNSPNKGNVYTRYHITTPVKYSLEAKERIRNSFELGLTRSLPNNLKDKIDVRTIYDEPTALLGSLLGDHFSKNTKEPQFFSIFDFGGGTLDYIFGVYRSPLDSGKVYLKNKEEEEYEHVIEIFNSGGSNECGGEKILKRMAYHIYLQNVEKLGKSVPILVPEGEEKSDQVNSYLYGTDVVNRINLEILVEKFAREILYGITFDKEKKDWISKINNNENNDKQKASFFENDKNSIANVFDKKNKDTIDVTLQTQNSKEESFNIEIEVDEILNVYKKIIKENIDGFIRDLKEVEKLDRVKDIIEEYKITAKNAPDFKIFLAGNSCKSPVVAQMLRKELTFSTIETLENTKKENNKYNLKTVVAKGYKRLNSDILIYNWKKENINGAITEPNSCHEPLKYRVVNFNLEDVEDIIPKNTSYSENNFKRFGGLELDKNIFNIYYTESSKKMTRDDIGKEIKIKSVVIPEDIMKKYVDNKGKVNIYIEAYGYDKIIYGFGKKKEIFKEVLDILNKILVKYNTNEKKQDLIEEKIDINSGNVDKLKELINMESTKVLEQLKKQITEDVLKELMNERLKITDNNIDSLSEEITNKINKQFETKEQNITKALNSKIEELKKENSEYKKSGDKMQEKLGKILMLLDEVKKSQEENFNNINNQNNSLELNIIETFKNIYDQNLIMKQQMKENENELNKYVLAFDGIKKLICSIDNLDSIKSEFYEKFNLVTNNETDNIIKLTFRKESEILKASLMALRDIKLENEEEITSTEIMFYNAINDFMKTKVVLVDKIDDKIINTKYWDVKENSNKFSKKIFPPIDTGNDILRGIAKGEY